MKFTKEEQKEIEASLKNVLADAKGLFDLIETDLYRFDFEDNERTPYHFEINQYGVYYHYRYSPNGNCIAGFKRNGNIHIYKNPHDLLFGFITNYEKIRKDLLTKAEKNQMVKTSGMEKVRELEQKYRKEAVIEVEMPDTLNRSTIEVVEEDGEKVGKLKIGPISIKILTTPNVRIINKKPNEKVKEKTK